MAGLAESPSYLERRMRALCLPLPRTSRLLAGALASATVLLVVVACEVPTPTVEEPAEDGAFQEVTAPPLPEAAAGASLADEPVFTPYTVAPHLRNASEVLEALEREYPAMLRGAGVGGQTLVHFFITETGEVGDARVATSSGHEALDRAALRVADAFEFSPAVNGDEAVPVWIALPITFRAGSAGSEGETSTGNNATGTGGAEPRTGEDESGATLERPGTQEGFRVGPTFTPYFTPYTAAPRLTNTTRVQQALADEYPPLLRDAGIEGQVLVHVYISDSGEVTNSRLERSSGHDALDAAALRVANTFEFSPALNEGAPVAVWIALPINFQAR